MSKILEAPYYSAPRQTLLCPKGATRRAFSRNATGHILGQGLETARLNDKPFVSPLVPGCSGSRPYVNPSLETFSLFAQNRVHIKIGVASVCLPYPCSVLIRGRGIMAPLAEHADVTCLLDRSCHFGTGVYLNLWVVSIVIAARRRMTMDDNGYERETK